MRDSRRGSQRARPPVARRDISPEHKVAAQRRLETLREAWSEILPTEQVRAIAESLPDTHGLTAADALQLAAALVWCRERPQGRAFVVLDARLSSAAARVGFTVIGDPPG